MVRQKLNNIILPIFCTYDMIVFHIHKYVTHIGIEPISLGLESRMLAVDTNGSLKNVHYGLNAHSPKNDV